MSIEIEAEPQPSSVCFMKGTSSHTPALPWGVAEAALPRKTISRETRVRRLFRVWRRLLRKGSANGESNDEHGHDNQDNPQEIAVGKVSGGKIFLSLARPLRKFREIRIAQLAYSFVNFLQVEIRGFQGFLPIFGGKQILDGGLVGLPDFGWTRRVLLQLVQ